MAKPNIEEVVQQIAQETSTPQETVTRMYEDTLAQYNEGAVIRDYLHVLVAKRVRENLRHPSGGKH
ncbi:MAG TPA: DUF3562 domain-containing protein [Paraburkholderia sp.]|nr:DUF3562 domain-containing protein [Paraburkholderia sp.]